jgi:hypothetical protein
MIKRFCEVCGEEITSSFTPWVIPFPGKNFVIRVSVQDPGLSNADICESCVAEAVLESTPEVKKKHEEKMEEVLTELQDLQIEKDAMQEELSALQVKE